MSALPKPAEPTSRLHVAFTQDVSRRLHAEAARRGVKASVLVGAVMKLLTDDDSLLDAVLDGESPASLAPGFAFMLNGLTRRQGAVLYELARNTDRFGVARITEHRLSRILVDTPVQTIHCALAALADRGLIARAESPEGYKRPWALTEAGWELANTLGDFGARR